MRLENVKVSELLKTGFSQQPITFETAMVILFSLLISLVMGIVIYLVYKIAFKGVVYRQGFAVTLIGMCVLTCMVTLAISTNVVLSLGMVGALSIVRYRTAIKDPVDLLYLFWSITSGITVGANMYWLALVTSIVMTVLLFVTSRKEISSSVYILIVHYQGDLADDAVRRAMGSSRYTLKSKTYRKADVEMALEVCCRHKNLTFVEKIREIESVTDATIIQYNGEYHG